MTWIWPPPNRPLSASYSLVTTRTSFTESSFGVMMAAEPQETLVILMPSRVTLLESWRPPLMVTWGLFSVAKMPLPAATSARTGISWLSERIAACAARSIAERPGSQLYQLEDVAAKRGESLNLLAGYRAGYHARFGIDWR